RLDLDAELGECPPHRLGVVARERALEAALAASEGGGQHGAVGDALRAGHADRCIERAARPDREALGIHRQRPFQSGSRFSRKARTPSAASSVPRFTVSSVCKYSRAWSNGMSDIA